MTYPDMSLEEALELAAQAKEEMFLNKFPKAAVVLAAEVRRLKARKPKTTQQRVVDVYKEMHPTWEDIKNKEK